MSSVLLDTHVLHWWSAEPDRLSPTATQMIRGADELAVSAITWFELAWLAKNERINVAIPIRSWLELLSDQVRTFGVNPAIADSAVTLPSKFPGDPADRLIYATAIEHGLALVTKDKSLLLHPHPRPLAFW